MHVFTICTHLDHKIQKMHMIHTVSTQWGYQVLFTSSLDLSTSFGSLVRPLLATVSISYGYTFTKGGIVLLWRMLCEAFAKHNESLKANGWGNNARSLHSNRVHKHQLLPKYDTAAHGASESVAEHAMDRWALWERVWLWACISKAESLCFSI